MLVVPRRSSASSGDPPPEDTGALVEAQEADRSSGELELLMLLHASSHAAALVTIGRQNACGSGT